MEAPKCFHTTFMFTFVSHHSSFAPMFDTSAPANSYSFFLFYLYSLAPDLPLSKHYYSSFVFNWPLSISSNFHSLWFDNCLRSMLKNCDRWWRFSSLEIISPRKWCRSGKSVFLNLEILLFESAILVVVFHFELKFSMRKSVDMLQMGLWRNCLSSMQFSKGCCHAFLLILVPLE